MAVTKRPSGHISTWSVARLEAEQARLAEERTRVRLEQNAVDAALAAARVVANLTDEQREAIAARAKGAD